MILTFHSRKLALLAVLGGLLGLSTSMASARPPKSAARGSPQESSDKPVASYLTRGPRSDAEADLLTEDANLHALAGRWKEASLAAERYLARYPAHARYPEILELRATALLHLNRPQDALPLWRMALQRGRSSSAATVRLRLARTYLELKRPAESRLLALREAQSLGSLRTEALLLRGEADLQLGRLLDADMALSAAQSQLLTRRNAHASGNAALSWEDSHLETQAHALRLQLAWHRCALLPSARALTEAQAIDQLTRRGTCLLEAALPRSPSVIAPYGARGPLTSWLLLPPVDVESRIRAGWENALHSYRQSCEHPPRPIEKKSPQELKNYRAELGQQLTVICEEHITRVSEALRENSPAPRLQESPSPKSPPPLPSGKAPHSPPYGNDSHV